MQQPTITMSQVDALVPYARNARQHSEAQIAQIAASIREFGWTNPILTDGERGVIAGHGRLAAARKLGITQVPTIELAHLSKAQRRALVLADNKLALSASWDDSLLAAEFEELELEGYDLAFTGFAEEEVRALRNTGTQGLTDPDDAPGVPEQPVSVLGDVWVLGKHRVMCGDSLSIDAVTTLMGGTLADVLITDPPYNVAVQGGNHGDPGRENGLKIMNDQMSDDAFRQFLRDAFVAAGRGCVLRLARRQRGLQLPRRVQGRGLEGPSVPSLGKGFDSDGPPGLSLEARAVSVRVEGRRWPPVGRRPQADDAAEV